MTRNQKQQTNFIIYFSIQSSIITSFIQFFTLDDDEVGDEGKTKKKTFFNILRFNRTQISLYIYYLRSKTFTSNSVNARSSTDAPRCKYQNFYFKFWNLLYMLQRTLIYSCYICLYIYYSYVVIILELVIYEYACYICPPCPVRLVFLDHPLIQRR